MTDKENKREYDLRDLTNKPKEEKYNFWKINRQKREKIQIKINEKIKNLFQIILNHELAKHFYYNKEKNKNLKTNLWQLEIKMNRGKYHSIFKFAKDLRNILDYFFKINAENPTEFQNVFEFSEFCEKNINNFYNETSNKKIKNNIITQNEKEIVENEILNLNQKQLQKLIQEFKDDFKWDINNENFEIDIDIDKLQFKQFEKLKFFLRNCNDKEKKDFNLNNYNNDEKTLSNSSINNDNILK